MGALQLRLVQGGVSPETTDEMTPEDIFPIIWIISVPR